MRAPQASFMGNEKGYEGEWITKDIITARVTVFHFRLYNLEGWGKATGDSK